MRRPSSAIGRVSTRIRPASSTEASDSPGGVDQPVRRARLLLGLAFVLALLLPLEDARLVGHRLAAGDVDDEDPRRRVVALGVDETPRGPLDIVRRRQVGAARS